MKKLSHRVILFAVIAILIASITITAFAETIFQLNGFKYAVTSSTEAALYGRTDESAKLTIPKSISDHYITHIADSAFVGDENIEELDLTGAELLRSIGFYAFKDCINLSGRLILTGRLNQLGASAFEGCSSLEEVLFSNTYVSTVPDQCFYGCSALQYVRLDSSVTAIEKLAFANCTILGGIVIPKTVTSISSSAFSGSPNVVINCYSGSYAEQFAKDNDMIYILLDAPTEDPTDPEPEYTVYTFMRGDADGDNEITILDATRVQRVLAHFTDADPDGKVSLRAALDADKVLSILDATRIQRMLAKFDDPYGIGETETIYIMKDGTIVYPDNEPSA